MSGPFKHLSKVSSFTVTKEPSEFGIVWDFNLKFENGDEKYIRAQGLPDGLIDAVYLRAVLEAIVKTLKEAE